MNFDLSPALIRIQSMVNGFIMQIPNIIIGIVVFILFFFLARAIRGLVRRVAANRKNKNLSLVLGRLAQWVVVLFGLFVALSILIPDFTAGELIQLLGISGVAIGFAFRDILQNFLAGIIILLTEPFKIGDQIVVNNFEGTVEDIHTRATTITTYDGRRVVIPNADLLTDSVIVNTANDKRRLEYDFGIGFGDDIGEAKGLILQTLKRTDGILSDPSPEVLVVSLGDFSVNLRARWWIRPPRQVDVVGIRDTVIAAVKNELVANGIDLPFPTQQILFHDQTEESDGDRRTQREGWPAGHGDVPAPRTIAGTLKRHSAGQNTES